MSTSSSALWALLLVLGLVVGACSSTDQAAPKAGFTIAVPLPEGDHVASFREAEAKLRQEGREKAGLSKLGPGAPALVAFMDRTASFQLVQLPGKVKAQQAARGPGGRLAAPLAGLPPDGAPVFATYLMTTVFFNELVAQAASEKSSASKTATLAPDTDEVTVSGNKGTITTTTTATVTLDRSKVSLDIKMKVAGEVRDAVTGAVLYKVSAEATGHADGDACPDASGTARARMQFTGKEDQFDAAGAQTGSSVSEAFGGEIRFKVDDNAKLAGVEVSPNGQGAEIMLRLAATTAGPTFEKVWRSGTCVEVLVDPKGGEVESGSVTDVTAKVRHKIEGNELDKPVEAKLTSGVKTIDPSGSKVKSPAKFRFTAGSDAGDAGGVAFESVSNRGIGQTSVTFTVGGGWTISSTGTLKEDFGEGTFSGNFRVSMKELKVTAGKDGALTGSGTLSLSGTIGSLGDCSGPIEQTANVTASGTVVGTGPGAVLRLKLSTPATPGVTFKLSCLGLPLVELISEAHTDRFGVALGEFELPADGGTKAVRGTATFGEISFTASANFTVARAKK